MLWSSWGGLSYWHQEWSNLHPPENRTKGSLSNIHINININTNINIKINIYISRMHSAVWPPASPALQLLQLPGRLLHHTNCNLLQTSASDSFEGIYQLYNDLECVWLYIRSLRVLNAVYHGIPMPRSWAAFSRARACKAQIACLILHQNSSRPLPLTQLTQNTQTKLRVLLVLTLRRPLQDTDCMSRFVRILFTSNSLASTITLTWLLLELDPAMSFVYR